jgi:S1-C subfamily serine protease
MGKAGILPNDLIISFRGKQLSAQRPLADLWKQAQQTRGEGPAAVEFQRGGETKTLEVTWSR